jgi:hypothetical protein
MFYAPYQLKPTMEFSGVHKTSDGLLLRFVDESIAGGESFSLYHPIETLGDLPIREFLNSDEKRQLLTDKILNLSLNANENISGLVESYYLSSSWNHLLKNKDKIFKDGFKLVKLKAANLKEIDFRILDELPFDYIFDFNGREKLESFKSLDKASKFFLKERTKYIEDPYQLNLKTNEKMDFKLASDFINYKDQSDYFIVKPTGFNHNPFVESKQNTLNKSLVVTSYLDHPVGQLLAAKWAVHNKIFNACGLWTHVVFESNAYSELFKTTGKIDLGLKDEFISLLKNEEWRPF